MSLLWRIIRRQYRLFCRRYELRRGLLRLLSPNCVPRLHSTHRRVGLCANRNRERLTPRHPHEAPLGTLFGSRTQRHERALWRTVIFRFRPEHTRATDQARPDIFSGTVEDKFRIDPCSPPISIPQFVLQLSRPPARIARKYDETLIFNFSGRRFKRPYNCPA